MFICITQSLHFHFDSKKTNNGMNESNKRIIVTKTASILFRKILKHMWCLTEYVKAMISNGTTSRELRVCRFSAGQG